MRLLQISVPDDERDALVEVLRDRQLGYTVTDGAGDQADRSVINFVVPADAVEHVLADLESEGFDTETYTVSLDAEFATFEHVDEVQDKWAKTPNKIAPQTLRSKAKDLRLNTRSYLWMMILSAIVATAGLLMSSPAVVVGSMVIAPIVSPSLTASVGAVRNDRDMVVDSIHMQLLGLGIAVVTAVAFSLFVKQFHVVPVQLAIEEMELMSLRLSPSMLSIVIALAAGAAGAYGLATKGRTIIVGVMIAAALIPTAAATGIGVAWGNPVVAIGSLLLLVLNIISVNLGGAAMLFYLEYRPDEVDESVFTVSGARQALVVVGTALLVAAIVVSSGAAFYQQSSFERTANNAVTDVLSEEEYRALDVSAITVEYDAPRPFDDETVVTVTLVRTDDREYADLPNALARAISGRTGEDVVVQVRYVDYERSDDAASVRAPRAAVGVGVAAP